VIWLEDDLFPPLVRRRRTARRKNVDEKGRTVRPLASPSGNHAHFARADAGGWLASQIKQMQPCVM